MKQVTLTIEQNKELAANAYEMVLRGDVSAVTRPGQFVDIRLPGRYLRRPISVCDCEPGRLTLIYKVLGEGTAEMTRMEPGTELDVLTGLGNGFDLSKAGDDPVLIGGGIGIPPLYWLAKELIKSGKTPSVVLGFNTADEMFYADEFRALGCEVTVATVDGSYGIKGYVTNAVNKRFSQYFACGPGPMLKAVHALPLPGQLSLEERMGCGFGACMGCSIKTKDGYKRVCKDGPVFDREELPW
ncbi:MAG: dihydroorotate dehydrogenase electron transfer subunit [Firmicutes bacterium]|nr:dihydroorotate dehydrogenase electron transfer subunit [Bacillota bacterium]